MIFQYFISIFLLFSINTDAFFELHRSTKEKAMLVASILLVGFCGYNFDRQCQKNAPCRTAEEQEETIELIKNWKSSDNRNFFNGLGDDHKYSTVKPLYKALFKHLSVYKTPQEIETCVKTTSTLIENRSAIIETVKKIQHIGANIIKKYDERGLGVLSKERKILESDIFDCHDNQNVTKLKNKFIFDNFKNGLQIVKYDCENNHLFLRCFYGRYSSFMRKYLEIFPEKIFDNTKRRLNQMIPIIEKKVFREEQHIVHRKYQYSKDYACKMEKHHSIDFSNNQFFMILNNFPDSSTIRSTTKNLGIDPIFALEEIFQLIQDCLKLSTNILCRMSCQLCKSALDGKDHPDFCDSCFIFKNGVQAATQSWKFPFEICDKNTIDQEKIRFKDLYFDVIQNEICKSEIDFLNQVKKYFSDAPDIIQKATVLYCDRLGLDAILNMKRESIYNNVSEEIRNSFSVYVDYCCAENVVGDEQKINVLRKEIDSLLNDKEAKNKLSNDEMKILNDFEIIFDNECPYEVFASTINGADTIVKKYDQDECSICYSNQGSRIYCNNTRSSNFLCNACYNEIKKNYISDTDESSIFIECPYCKGGSIFDEKNNHYVCDQTIVAKKKTTQQPPVQDIRQIMREAGIEEDDINANMNQENVDHIIIHVDAEQLRNRLIHLYFLRYFNPYPDPNIFQEIVIIQEILRLIHYNR